MDKIKDKIKYCDEIMTNPFEDERKIDINTFLYTYCLIWGQVTTNNANKVKEEENEDQ